MDKKIEKLLNTDALSEAEKITGKSYKEDKLTEAIGLSNHIALGKEKEKLLKSVGDSTSQNTELDYLKIVEGIGFKSLLIEPFTNKDNIEERLHIMWHYEHSILLVFDTHTWGDDGSWAKAGRSVPPPSINGGSFYYNWKPNGELSYFNGLSSGGYVEEEGNFVWSGSHDCREAIVFNINNLSKNGSFIENWVECPFLWLLHYMDTKIEGYDYNTINKERLSKLPIDVQNKIKHK